MRARRILLAIATGMALVALACAPQAQPSPRAGSQAAPAGQAGSAPAAQVFVPR